MNTNKKKEMKVGKVYSIRSYETDKIYIGSTFQPLNKRMCSHRQLYKCHLNGKKTSKTRAFDILQFDDAYIELVDIIVCMNTEQLRACEGMHQRLNRDIMTNHKIEGRPQR